MNIESQVLIGISNSFKPNKDTTLIKIIIRISKMRVMSDNFVNELLGNRSDVLLKSQVIVIPFYEYVRSLSVWIY